MVFALLMDLGLSSQNMTLDIGQRVRLIELTGYKCFEAQVNTAISTFRVS